MEIGTQVIKVGDSKCEHSWKDSGITLDCLPPVYTRYCSKCDRVESYSDDREIVSIQG